MSIISLAEKRLLPDFLIRTAIRRLLAARLSRSDAPRDDERTLAAQLLAVARSGDADDVARALAGAGAEGDARVLAAIDRTLERGSLAVGVHRVARALEDRWGRGLAQLQRRTSQ